MTFTMPEAGRFCARCVYSSSISEISFDDEGVCSYCRHVEVLALKFGTGSAIGLSKWNQIVLDIKRAGTNSRYDCIIGVSGGTDSSYLLLLAKQVGLRPLAVHYDNTWNTAQAAHNIRNVTTALGVDLYTFVANNVEVDDMKLSFLRAGIREWEVDTDIAFAQVLRSAASKFRVAYILEGHSFIAEGISPLGDNYMDGKYVTQVHKRFGSMKAKHYPNLTFWQFMKWTMLTRQKFVRPLWYLDYSKEKAREILESETGWVDYGGHHLENRASAFLHQYYLPTRFSIDFRYLSVGARVRAGIISRAEGLRIMASPVEFDSQLSDYVLNRLGLSQADFDILMKGKTRSWRDFKTYKRRFEVLRPLFFMLSKMGRIAPSFYQKYCFPMKASSL